MLRIVIPERELFDEKTEEFLKTKEQTLQLEHSLVSLSKWESKWHKPFLVKDEKSFDETIDYIRCMTLSKNIDPKVYSFLTEENIKEINDYIGDPMTATTFNDRDNKKSNNLADTDSVTTLFSHLPKEFESVTLDLLLSACLDQLDLINRKMISDNFILSQGIWLTEAEKVDLTEYDENGQVRP